MIQALWHFDRAIVTACIVGLFGCGATTEPILPPDTDPLPLTLENLRGRWEEQAQIYTRLGAQTGVLIDTTAVPPSDRIIYEFAGEGAGVVRHIQPAPGEALLRIESNGVSWVIGSFESYAATLSAERLSLTDGLTVSHRFPEEA